MLYQKALLFTTHLPRLGQIS